MEKIHGIITVRTFSSRLPNKCLLPFGEKINVIQHIIKRCKKFNIDPILCTTIDERDDILQTLAQNEKILFYRGSVKNKLKRWSDCVKQFKLKDFHTVDADDPFFDGEEMHLSMRTMREGNFDVVNPTISSSNGGASVGYSIKSKILELALKDTNEETDTEMMWFYLEKIKNIKSHTLTETRNNPQNIRLTLDYPEDYNLLLFIQQILGNNTSRDEINKLFSKNPDLYKINWFRNSEWKQTQESKKIK
jgi:spore coat polysaccharide biosynthesis protein SpsF